jgi:hypothetical protein
MREMTLYTETEINKEIWDDREHLLSQTYPEDSANEYADSAVPIYYSDIIEAWRDLPDEYSNKFHEVSSELPDRVEDLMRTDVYLYYQMLYSGAVQELINGKILVDDEWTDKPEESN